MRFKLCFFPILLLLAGCAGEPQITTAAPDADSTRPPDPTATWTATSPPTPTITPSPSHTPSPTPPPTQTRTPTPSATPQPLVGVINAENTKIVTGPGGNYALLAIVNPGFAVEVVGRGADSAWLVVKMGSDQFGWVPQDLVEVEADFDVLQIFEIPPVPPPTETPVPVPVIWHEFSGPGYWGTLRTICIKVSGLGANETFDLQVILVGPEYNYDARQTVSATQNGNYSSCGRVANPGDYTVIVHRSSGLPTYYFFNVFSAQPTDTKTPDP